MALTTPPVLSIPTSTELFILDTDASGFTVAAEPGPRWSGNGNWLSQLHSLERTKEVLHNAPRAFGCSFFTRQFRPYLIGRPFMVRTDHNSFRWLTSFKEPQGQLARWLEELSQYDLEIVHRPGKSHANADFLCRMPDPNDCGPVDISVPLRSLPCGGCGHCTRVHRKWTEFSEDVDNVVPISVTAHQIVSSSGNGEILDLNDMVVLQHDDPIIVTFLSWLSGEGPTEGVLSLSEPALRHMWMSRQLFLIQAGLLYRIHPDTRALQLVVPSLLRRAHDIPTAGHQGVKRKKRALTRLLVVQMYLPN